MSHLEDLLVQLPTDAVLFIDKDWAATIPNLPGGPLDDRIRHLATAYHCELSIDDSLDSAPGVKGYSFRRC